MIPTLAPIVTPLPRAALAPVQRVTVCNGGVQLGVWATPPVGRATVLLVPGVGWHTGYLGTLAAELHARGLHVLALDPPAQGRSAPVHGAAYLDVCARAFTEARSLAGPGPLLGVGLGLLAADLTLHALLSRTLDAAAVHGVLMPDLVPLPRRWMALRGAVTAVPERVPVPLHKTWAWSNVLLDPAVLQTRLGDQACGWSPRAGTLRAFLDAKPAIPASGNEAPCLVLGAERDEVTRPRHALRCFQTLGGPKSLQVLADAGHDLTARFAPALADVLSGFVDDVRARNRTAVSPAPLGNVRHTPGVVMGRRAGDLPVPPSTPVV